MFEFLHLEPNEATLLTEAQREGVNLFGAGNFARAVHAALKTIKVKVHSFIVTKPNQDSMDQVPVLGLEDLDEAALAHPLWVAVYNHNANADLFAISAQCRVRGISRVILPQEYYEVIQHQLGWRYWLTDRRLYIGVRKDIESSFALLTDEESKYNFIATLKFRLGLPIENNSMPISSPQYFTDEVSSKLQGYGRGCIFVDGGAYDGDTLIQAAVKIPLARAYAFEPDLTNFSRLTKNIVSLGLPIVAFPCGLSNHNDTLTFAGNNGEASSVSEEGNIHIPCVRLDECLVGEKVDFIKLDIEGHELSALQGASRIITRYRPVLAVAAYHRWDDLWRIPLTIFNLDPGYRISYRIHEYNTYESVIYAIPDDNIH